MIKYYCDVCEKEIEDDKNKISFSRPSLINSGSTDLGVVCYNCLSNLYRAFNKPVPEWVEKEKAEEDEKCLDKH